MKCFGGFSYFLQLLLLAACAGDFAQDSTPRDSSSSESLALANKGPKTSQDEDLGDSEVQWERSVSQEIDFNGDDNGNPIHARLKPQALNFTTGALNIEGYACQVSNTFQFSIDIFIEDTFYTTIAADTVDDSISTLCDEDGGHSFSLSIPKEILSLNSGKIAYVKYRHPSRDSSKDGLVGNFELKKLYVELYSRLEDLRKTLGEKEKIQNQIHAIEAKLKPFSDNLEAIKTKLAVNSAQINASQTFINNFQANLKAALQYWMRCLWQSPCSRDYATLMAHKPYHEKVIATYNTWIGERTAAEAKLANARSSSDAGLLANKNNLLSEIAQIKTEILKTQQTPL